MSTKQAAERPALGGDGAAVSPAPPGAPAGGGGRLEWTLGVVAANALLVGLVALIVIFGTLNEAFLTVDNFRNVFIQASVISVVAVPTAMLVISGKVDLSIGSTLALGAVVTGLLLTHGTPTALAILAGVASGAAVGTVNGVLVTAWGFSPIIVTLGALTAVRGLALTLSPDALFGFGDSFLNLGEGEVLGVPYLVVIAIVAFALGAVVLSQTPMGRHIYAIGVNEEATYLSGVRVVRVTLLLFVLTGAAAALAGVMLAARLGSAPSGALGVGFELDVLTAVILGGVAFNGGRGTIGGVLLGVLFLGLLQNGLTLENVPASAGLLVKGVVLVIAAGLDQLTVRAGGRGTLFGPWSRRQAAPAGAGPDGGTTSHG